MAAMPWPAPRCFRWSIKNHGPAQRRGAGGGTARLAVFGRRFEALVARGWHDHGAAGIKRDHAAIIDHEPSRARQHVVDHGAVGAPHVEPLAGADPAQGNKWGFTALDWGTWPQNSAEVLALLKDANR